MLRASKTILMLLKSVLPRNPNFQPSLAGEMLRAPDFGEPKPHPFRVLCGFGIPNDRSSSLGRLQGWENHTTLPHVLSYPAKTRFSRGRQQARLGSSSVCMTGTPH